MGMYQIELNTSILCDLESRIKLLQFDLLNVQTFVENHIKKGKSQIKNLTDLTVQMDSNDTDLLLELMTVKQDRIVTELIQTVLDMKTTCKALEIHLSDFSPLGLMDFQQMKKDHDLEKEKKSSSGMGITLPRCNP